MNLLCYCLFVVYAAFQANKVVYITALHVMQTRYSDENSVCPSVTRVDCDKTEERSVQILYHTKDNLA